MFDTLFLQHPRSVGESYFEHLTTALGFAGRLAFFPRTASRIVADLHARMFANRRSRQASAFDYAI